MLQPRPTFQQIIFVVLVGFLPAWAIASQEPLESALQSIPELQDLRHEASCILRVSRYYQLDIGAFLAVLATENGNIGDRRLNKNGTFDYGPAQINSSWINRFRKRGVPVTESLLQNHTCFNLFASGWILRYELDRAPDFWTGIGRYHSRTPRLQKRYIRKVYRNWQMIYRAAAGTP